MWQDVLALTLVAACGGWAVWQAVKSLSGKKSRMGSCCTKGCSSQESSQTTKTQFLPADLLKKR
jgi:hypothetical protein